METKTTGTATLREFPPYEAVDMGKFLEWISSTIAKHHTGLGKGLLTMSDFTWQMITRYVREQGKLINAPENSPRMLFNTNVKLHQLPGTLTAKYEGDLDQVLYYTNIGTSSSRWTDSDFLTKNHLYHIGSDPVKKAGNDPTNPDYYKTGGMEVIDILRAKFTKEQFEGFLAGNVLKYTLRAGGKNGAEDLKKAAWYSSMLAGVDPRTKPTT